MKKKIWDLYASIYERAMKQDANVYDFMVERIPEVIQDKTVLEIATGPGLLARKVAKVTKQMIATDYSEGMIREAKKKECPDNLTFEVADATNLPYEKERYEVVIIANALHLIPEPERALKEIDRVLCKGGTLIAPNFVRHKGSVISRLWSNLLKLGGIRFEHQWEVEEYLSFLKKNGWKIIYKKELSARIPLLYVECKRENDY